MTVPGYVVDASVLLKWYLGRQEPDWEKADLLYRKFGAGEVRVIVPEYALYELANRFTGAGPRGPGWFLLAASQLLDRAPWDAEFLARSLELAVLARRHGISKATLYDALYVHLARETSFPLLTADRVQGSIGKWAGIEVVWLWRYGASGTG